MSLRPHGEFRLHCMHLGHVMLILDGCHIYDDSPRQATLILKPTHAQQMHMPGASCTHSIHAALAHAAP
jgi:hypothetical protein